MSAVQTPTGWPWDVLVARAARAGYTVVFSDRRVSVLDPVARVIYAPTWHPEPLHIECRRAELEPK